MKTPITYYGGKQKMVNHIIRMIPNHKIYVEPFAGGAAVFFAKRKTNAEFINDINGNVSAFYRAMKFNFKELIELIEGTLHCENTYLKAKNIYLDKSEIKDSIRAWAFWVNSCLSFGGQMASTFKFVKNKKDSFTAPTTINNKKKSFKIYQKRLENTVIFNKNAIEIINKLDSVDTFFYLDPPYVGTNQAHYSGYSQEEFDKLISLLENIKGKFLLSSYPNDSVYNSRFKNEHFEKALGLQARGRKTEVLTFNYDLNQKELNLFNQYKQIIK